MYYKEYLKKYSLKNDFDIKVKFIKETIKEIEKYNEFPRYIKLDSEFYLIYQLMINDSFINFNSYGIDYYNQCLNLRINGFTVASIDINDINYLE